MPVPAGVLGRAAVATRAPAARGPGGARVPCCPGQSPGNRRAPGQDEKAVPHQGLLYTRTRSAYPPGIGGRASRAVGGGYLRAGVRLVQGGPHALAGVPPGVARVDRCEDFRWGRPPAARTARPRPPYRAVPHPAYPPPTVAFIQNLAQAALPDESNATQTTCVRPHDTNEPGGGRHLTRTSMPSTRSDAGGAV